MRARPGFSLVELLVALAVLGLLMAGMAQVLAGSLRAGIALRDGLAVQRTLRWAAWALEPELRMAGFSFPPDALRPPAAGPCEAAFLLLPAQPVLKVVGGAAQPLAPEDDPLEPPGAVAEVLGLIMDRPLPGAGVLAVASGGRALPGAGGMAGGLGGGPMTGADALAWDQAATGSLVLRPLASLPVRAGDLLWVEGDRLECVRILAPRSLRTGVTAELAVAPGFAWPHAAGARVGLVRPRRVVYLTIAYLPLAGAERLVPCLVRLEGDWEGEAPPAWRELLAGWREGSESAAVLAEQVTGFRVACVWKAEVDAEGGALAPGGPGPCAPAEPGAPGPCAPEPGAPEPRAPEPGVPDPAAPYLGSRRRPVALTVTLTARVPGAPARRQALSLTVRPRNVGLTP